MRSVRAGSVPWHADGIEIDAASIGLVGRRGIDEPIAEDDRAALERRGDHLGNELGARSFEDEKLGQAAHLLPIRIEHHRAQSLAHGRAARFAQAQHLMAETLEHMGQNGDMRALPRPFATFEGDEDAG